MCNPNIKQKAVKMSHTVMELPEVIIKPVPPVSKRKLLAGALAVFLLYFWMFLLLHTAYSRSKRLDEIMETVVETQKKIANIQILDQDLAKKIAQIDELYEDY